MKNQLNTSWTSIQNKTRRRRIATCSGLAAILLWSVTIALVRSLSEQLGPVTAGASVYCVSGVLALVSLAWNRAKRTQLKQLPRTYIIVCGALFVCYMLLLFLAIGLAANRQQVLEVGLINYLWPPLTLIFAIVLIGTRARMTLWPATAVALAGIFLVLTQGDDVTLQSLANNLAGNPIAYTFGIGAAVTWALYSILTRKLADEQKTGAVDLFLPATAVTLLLLCCFVREPRAWGMRSCVEVVLLGITTFLAYGFWDHAMREGNVLLVAAASYLTPFLSAAVSCFYLSVLPHPRFWVGCGMLMAGSLLSWCSVSEAQDPST